jgi:hypothetical protein
VEGPRGRHRQVAARRGGRAPDPGS